jgi:hypothetical protein
VEAGLCCEGSAKDEKKKRDAAGSQQISNILTAAELRQCFSQAQNDGEETVLDNSELCFTEFIEAVSRLALAKWETPALNFGQKIGLALEAICGLVNMITAEEKQFLLPGSSTAKKSKGKSRKKYDKNDTHFDIDFEELATQHRGMSETAFKRPASREIHAESDMARKAAGQEPDRWLQNWERGHIRAGREHQNRYDQKSLMARQTERRWVELHASRYSTA